MAVLLIALSTAITIRTHRIVKDVREEQDATRLRSQSPPGGESPSPRSMSGDSSPQVGPPGGTR